MNQKSLAVGLVVLGFFVYLFPHYGGVFGPRLDVTSGDALITFAIFIIGAMILWHMPSRS